MPAQPRRPTGAGVRSAASLIVAICRNGTGLPSLAPQISVGSPDPDLHQIVRARRTPPLFDWMVETFSFQGISDRVAASYLHAHGGITWHEISQMVRDPACPLLDTYWTYESCRYDKTRRTCSHPRYIRRCPVPKAPLRNGHLNQTAFSFFLFVRDVADSDLFGWIDDQLSAAGELGDGSAQEALVGPTRHVFGVSDKVLTMTLSSVLMADREARPDWYAVGIAMIVVDRLVHNFLVRTGILEQLGMVHPYGPRCYADGGCAEVLRRVSAQIDARQFDGDFTPDFPRFVQHALWHYCAADGLNVCNGNNIDDRKSCDLLSCIVHSNCAKKALKLQ